MFWHVGIASAVVAAFKWRRITELIARIKRPEARDRDYPSMAPARATEDGIGAVDLAGSAPESPRRDS
jgi:hypothetical protein